jgi:hypothetical protein
MPDNVVFAAGTTATYKNPTSTGTAVALDGLISIGANPKTRTDTDITELSGLILRKRPVRTDPGTVSLTFNMKDTAPSTNQFTVLSALVDAGTLIDVIVNLPGTFDNTTQLIPVLTGYLKDITTPEIATGDDKLTYSVTLQQTT